RTARGAAWGRRPGGARGAARRPRGRPAARLRDLDRALTRGPCRRVVGSRDPAPPDPRRTGRRSPTEYHLASALIKGVGMADTLVGTSQRRLEGAAKTRGGV